MYDFDFTYDIHPNSKLLLFMASFCTVDSHVWYSVVLILFCLLVVFFFVKHSRLFIWFPSEKLIILSKCA